MGENVACKNEVVMNNSERFSFACLFLLFIFSFASRVLCSSEKDLTSEAMKLLGIVDRNVTIDDGIGTSSEGSLLPDPISNEEKEFSEEDEEENIYLNFQNATLESIVNYVMEKRKVNVIPHKNLKTITTSLTTRKPLSFRRAWNVVLTLLEMNNFSLIKVGDVYRIISLQERGREPLPVYSSGRGVEPEQLPDNDKIVRYIYFFRNMKAENAAAILGSMLGPQTVQVNKDLEACIITAKSNSIKESMKIIKHLDVGGAKDSIRLVRLKLADAATVAKLFEEIIGQKNDIPSTAERLKEREHR